MCWYQQKWTLDRGVSLLFSLEARKVGVKVNTFIFQKCPIPWLGLWFNINGPCVVATVGFTDTMLSDMALASIPLAVGTVARSLIEEGLLLESLVWVL